MRANYAYLIIAIILVALMDGCIAPPTVTPTATPILSPSPTPTPFSTPSPMPTLMPIPWRGTIGVCHGVAYPWPEVDWGYPSGESVFWGTVEVTPGEYNFAPLWSYIERAESSGRMVVLQVQTNSPGRFATPTIPTWYWNTITELPDCPASVPDCASYWHSKPAPWDENYLNALEEMVTAFATEFDGHPALMGVLIAGPGNYNEMSQTVGACYGSPGADVTRTDSVYIRSLAAEIGESPAILTAPYTDTDGRHYVAKFDYYYVEYSKRLARIYLDAFRHTASILQVGSGVSCQAYVAQYVVDDLIAEGYADRLWLKQNGWGNAVPSPTDMLFRRYRGTLRTMYEVGHYGLWCDASHPDAARYGCKGEDAEIHNSGAIASALDAGVSAVCFQSVFFSRPDVFGLDRADMRELGRELMENKLGHE